MFFELGLGGGENFLGIDTGPSTHRGIVRDLGSTHGAVRARTRRRAADDADLGPGGDLDRESGASSARP